MSDRAAVRAGAPGSGSVGAGPYVADMTGPLSAAQLAHAREQLSELNQYAELVAEKHRSGQGELDMDEVISELLIGQAVLAMVLSELIEALHEG